GQLSFLDVDLSNTHTISVDAPGGYLGNLTVTQTTDSTGTPNNDGRVSWTYTIADTALDYLAQGETSDQTYTVTVADTHGPTDTQTIDIHLTGTNDRPDIYVTTGDTASASITEVDELTVRTAGDATTHTHGGQLSFLDLDLSNTHSIS